MALILPTVGENKCLEFMTGYSTPGNQTLKLFVTNTTPADGDTASTYTEMTTLGYAAKTLTKGSWAIAQNGGVAEAVYAEQTWTFTAGTAVTVYGYFVIDSTSGALLWSEAFNTGKLVQNTGDIIRITPKITLSKV